MSDDDLRAPAGREVTAKRFGWGEEPTAAQALDHEPYAEEGYESDDLRGRLAVVPFATPDGRPHLACLVGGQAADPKTVRPVSP